MVEIISGEKGKGKTRVLLDKVHEDLKKSGGSLIFIDKNNHHMFDLDSKVRLINMEDFDMSTTGEFLGFISGIISSNRDIEKIYLDSFLTTAFIDTSESLADAVEKLKTLSDKFETDFLLSVSKKSEDLPEAVKSAVIASL
ncbi:MAG: twitching motility protein PilT [Lachnospiraceae bacterium]|nr:twitching motility protein PilT [Lachnospiraceae bacterium]MCR5211956.1 twitching motility protein PilT [Lachnospiraceae bacterium]